MNFVVIIAVMFLAYQLEFALGQPAYTTISSISEQLMSPEEVQQIQDGTYQGSYSSSIDEDGSVTYYKPVFTDAEQVPNPKYLRPPLRNLLTHLDAILPHGQVNEYISCLTDSAYGYLQPGNTPEPGGIDAYPRLKTFPLYSCLDIVLVSAIGLLLFRKKEIR